MCYEGRKMEGEGEVCLGCKKGRGGSYVKEEGNRNVLESLKRKGKRR